MSGENRRKGYLPASSEIKEDLQEIFATAEDSYRELHTILTVAQDMEKAIDSLQTMLSDYTETDEKDSEEKEDKLSQIIQYCSDLGDNFEHLLDSLNTNSENQVEETKKNRILLNNITSTYKIIHGHLLNIKKELEDARLDRGRDSVAIKDIVAKLDLINTAMQLHSPLILFFKNMKDDEILLLLPTLKIAVQEILKDKGYTPQGEKKDLALIFLNLLIVQLRNNALAILSALIISWLVGGYSSGVRIAPGQPSKEEVEALKQEIKSLKETDQKLESEITSGITNKGKSTKKNSPAKETK